jgi:hypothetical protein
MSLRPNILLIHLALVFVILGAGSACAVLPRGPESGPDASEITFDLAQINDEGLSGPPDGLVAIDYEFCIPVTQQAQQEVSRIDPTVKLYPGSAGRIGCSKDQVLAIGNTHQKGWKTVLLQLTALDYVKRIDRSFGE